MLTIAICEDEQYMLDSLKKKIIKYLKERDISHELKCFKSGDVLLQCKEKFELIFLDIQMKGTQGMETARILRQRGFTGLIIFITALKEMVFESFKVEAFDFLVKPFEILDFSRTLGRAIDRINTDKQINKEQNLNLIVHKNNEQIIVPYNEIIYCESINRKVYLHTKKKVIDYYNRLEELEQNLGYGFYRCHRSYLINLIYVRGTHNRLAYMENDEKVPISRLREQEFSRIILEFMKGKRC